MKKNNRQVKSLGGIDRRLFCFDYLDSFSSAGRITSQLFNSPTITTSPTLYPSFFSHRPCSLMQGMLLADVPEALHTFSFRIFIRLTSFLRSADYLLMVKKASKLLYFWLIISLIKKVLTNRLHLCLYILQSISPQPASSTAKHCSSSNGGRI